MPGVARLMALAIHFDELLREGVVKGYRDIARLLRITPERVTQIMNLLPLAPDIQEDILFLPRYRKRKPRVTERWVTHRPPATPLQIISCPCALA